MIAQTAWPENVIARYLTIGGATVDLTHVAITEDTKATRSTCTGCLTTERSHWRNQYPSSTGGYVDFQDRDKGDRNAREWAQSHADTCRALPMPSAESASVPPAAEPEPKRRLWFPTRRKTA
ncbi:hypothetical protein ASD97_24820 [Streptomyces sp. Root63]|uniref:hypothetical protein n=1 Tax=unclassified Streptomyces TaxID=2593676 RepID=UPI0006F6E540|nr:MULTISPECIES: hypothetical protein [unclassified Streptomyces]KQX27527.1 hypothetical protein ASD29_30050 [Streptomyces sp. Root1295]KRA34767.1 hypothetical protein ASD97_24820 [Streptomyces sp. Root63]